VRLGFKVILPLVHKGLCLLHVLTLGLASGVAIKILLFHEELIILELAYSSRSLGSFVPENCGSRKEDTYEERSCYSSHLPLL